MQEILKQDTTVAQIASEYSVHPSQLSTWKVIALKGLPTLFSRDQKSADNDRQAHEKQINELYAEIGRLTTHLVWVKRNLRLRLPTLFAYFERGNHIAIQRLEELSHEKSSCA